jgi:hypothetical protein
MQKMLTKPKFPTRKTTKSVATSFSFSHRDQGKKRLKNSEMMRYIDCCLFQNKKNFPVFDQGIQKIFPIKLSKPIHTLNVPALFPNSNIVIKKIVKKEAKLKKPGFYEIKKSYNAIRRTRINVAKSLDDKFLMNIQGFSEPRPKSVILKKKVSCVMQTDDLFDSLG